MNDSITPDWIKEIEAAEAVHTAAARATVAEDSLRAKTIQADGPAYWRLLQKELYIAVEGLKRVGITGVIEDAFAVKEKGIQVRIQRTDRPSKQAFVKLFYTDGDPGIQRYPATAEGVSALLFDVHNDTMALYGDGDALTPEAAARFILEPMVKNVKT